MDLLEKENLRRLRGKQYHEMVFAEAEKDFGKTDLSMLEIYLSAAKLGNVWSLQFVEDQNYRPGLVMAPFSNPGDRYVIGPIIENSSQFNLSALPENGQIYDKFHSWSHVLSDRIQNYEDELSLTCAQATLLKGHSQEEYTIRHYVYNHEDFYFQKGQRNIGVESPPFLINMLDGKDLESSINVRRDMINDNFVIEPYNINISAIKERVNEGELAITRLNALEAAARGAFGRIKISNAFEHGIEVFYSRQMELDKMPASTIYCEDSERELAWQIAQDKPVSKSRQNYTSSQIMQVKEVVAVMRSEIEKI